MRALVFILIVGFFAAPSVYAQNVPRVDPCGQDFKRTVTRAQVFNNQVNWRAFLDGCDSFVIASDSAYNYMIFEREFYKELNGRLESLVKELEDGRMLRDSLISEQKNFIAFQQDTINKYDNLLEQSNTLVERATANTDKALNRLRLLKWASIGGIAIGAGGLLVALAAN